VQGAEAKETPFFNIRHLQRLTQSVEFLEVKKKYLIGMDTV